MYGSISWWALTALLLFAVLWEGHFNLRNGKGPRLPRRLRKRPEQKGLLPPSTSRFQPPDLH